MGAESFTWRSRLAASPRDVYEWHGRPGALERLIPPWEAVRVIDRVGGIANGDRTTLRVGLGPVWVEWVAEHRGHEPGRRFTDVQVRGPFSRWEHTHSFEPDGAGGCVMEDRIEYALPDGVLVRRLGAAAVRRRLRRSFAYRHRVVARDLELHRRYPFERPQRFLVSGATGLVGSALTATLTSGGHEVARLARPGSRPPAAGERIVRWNPAAGAVDPLGPTDAVVHLAGANIAAGRWTEERRRRIRDSRVRGTRVLAEAVAAADPPPRTLICASAIGYYGDRGDEPVDETAGPGGGFLPEVCTGWERAADPARRAGVRVVHLRIGIVLTPAGGALSRMLIPFRLCVGGPFGDGRQFMSWVSLDDVVGAILHCVARGEVEGAVNAVAPAPLRNRELARALGRTLGRPAAVPVPAAVLEGLLGEMATELLLSSTRVAPATLERTGFVWRDPELEPSLRHMLGHERRDPDVEHPRHPRDR